MTLLPLSTTRRSAAALIASLAIAITSTLTAPSLAQTTEPKPPTTQPATQPIPPPTPPYELADIPTQAESTASTLEDIGNSIDNNSAVDNIANEMPALNQQIAAKLSDTTRLITPSVSLDILRSQEQDWSVFHDKLLDYRKELAERVSDLEGYQRRLGDLERAWSATTQNLRSNTAPATQPADGDTTAPAAPPAATLKEVVERAEKLLREIKTSQGKVNRQKAVVSSLQNQIGVLDVRVSEMSSTIRRASERAFARLLTPDSKPLWDVVLGRDVKPAVHASTTIPTTGPTAVQNLAQQGTVTLSSQLSEVQAYFVSSWRFLIKHALVIALIAGALVWIRKRVQRVLATDRNTVEEAVIFDMPVSTAMVCSILLWSKLYPGAPRLFAFIVVGFALIPTAMVLRRLVSLRLRPLLHALLAFTLIGLALNLAASLPLLSRWLYLFEMGGVAAFVAWYLYHQRQFRVAAELSAGNPVAPTSSTAPSTPSSPASTPPSATPKLQISKRSEQWAATALTVALRTAFAVTLASAIANILGYLTLAKLLSNALVVSGYIAMVLHAGVVLADTLVMGIMSIRPVSDLRMVKNRGHTIRTWFHRLFVLLAVIYWAQRTLVSLSIWRQVSDNATDVLTATWTAGALQISLAKALYLVAAVVLAIGLSRLIRFLLEEDVYPRLPLAKGIPYAISTLIHYVILLFGFLTAMSMVYDMTQFTILASAFGIGLGFGMQNIVNNFVSGLILLFERPVRVGDIIELGGVSATVTRIGIRASVVRLNNAAEIIIPNAQLISDKVTNWTLSNRQRGLELNLKIAASDTKAPPQVLELLCTIAKHNPLVSTNPVPKTVITDMAGDVFTYQLRAWTNRYEDWTSVRSQLLEAIHEQMKAEGLELK